MFSCFQIDDINSCQKTNRFPARGVGSFHLEIKFGGNLYRNSSQRNIMKSISSVCVLAAIVSVTNAQFGGGFFGRGPFFGGWGFPGIDPLTAALFFGFGKQ